MSLHAFWPNRSKPDHSRREDAVRSECGPSGWPTAVGHGKAASTCPGELHRSSLPAGPPRRGGPARRCNLTLEVRAHAAPALPNMLVGRLRERPEGDLIAPETDLRRSHGDVFVEPKVTPRDHQGDSLMAAQTLAAGVFTRPMTEVKAGFEGRPHLPLQIAGSPARSDWTANVHSLACHRLEGNAIAGPARTKLWPR